MNTVGVVNPTKYLDKRPLRTDHISLVICNWVCRQRQRPWKI